MGCLDTGAMRRRGDGRMGSACIAMETHYPWLRKEIVRIPLMRSADL